MKTIKMYLAPTVDKIHKEIVNSQGEPFISQRYVTVPSKKNQQQAIVSKSTGQSFIKQSDQYIKWKKLVYPFFYNEANKIIQDTGITRITRAKMKIIFYFPNYLPRDLTNKSESIMDALVDSKIIYDDKFQVSNKIALEGYICKNRPRTEIYIHIIDPESQEYEIDKTDYDKFNKQKSNLRKLIREWKNS